MSQGDSLKAQWQAEKKAVNRLRSYTFQRHQLTLPDVADNAPGRCHNLMRICSHENT
jgi:hypothetical protein